MTGDHDPTVRRLAHLTRQQGDDVAQFNLFPYPAGLRDGMRIEAYFQTRAVAFELVEDPLSSCADPTIRLVRIRESVARLEAFQLLLDFRDPIRRNLRDDLLNLRVEPLRRLGLFLKGLR